MKKLYRFSAIALLVLPLVFTSCSDYLDRDDDDNITEADVFARYEKVNGLVSDVYAAAKKADRPLVFFEHFSNSAITDECEGTNVEGNITNNFNNGAWNPNSLPGSVGQYWEALYEGIRKANLIIENVQKYNTPDNPQQDGDLRNRIGEMYFMRGYFHMLLLRMYGEAPYIDRVINAGDNMDFKKESVHSMVEKIVTDAQTAYGMVPNKYVKTSENFGRVDKGACLGLISFVRWVAATPLWNGASQYGYNLRRVFENEYAYDATRWRKAKEAAKAVLDFEVGGTKRYSLYTKHDANDFKDPADGNLNDSRVYARLWDMFYDMDAFANEYVFFMTKSKDQAWQGDIYPPSREGSSRQQPVQEQVDEYFAQIAVLFAMPGSPCIYYGTEIAMEGSYDPDCRRCMPWSDIEAGKYAERSRIISTLIHLRRQEPLLKSRNFHFPNDYAAYRRVIQFQKVDFPDCYVEVLINCCEEDVEVVPQGEILLERHYIDSTLLSNGILIRRIRK